MSNGLKRLSYECVDIADSDDENDHLRDPLDDADVKDVKLLAEDVWGLQDKGDQDDEASGEKNIEYIQIDGSDEDEKDYELNKV